MKYRCVTSLLVLSALAGFVQAEIYVDDNAPNDPAPYYNKGSDANEDGSAEHPFDDIQEAIDAAVDGDTIIVAPGRYLSLNKWEYDEITFDGKNIRLMSSAPTDFTVIDQTVLCGVVIFDGTETGDCLLQGFKIQNYGYGGVLGNDTLARISHCIISGNGPCGATVVKDVHGRISNCLIVDNTTFHDCGVLPVVSGFTELVNCTIANNLSAIDMSTDSPVIHNCIVYGNQTLQTVTGTATRGGSLPTISYCLVEDFSRSSSGIIDADPCFVQPGSWVEESTGTATRGSPASRQWILAEGDYRLKTEGWRWSPQPIHGSHWYFDAMTSPAVDAGDPMDGLGEELERAPDDPEGIWGVNHAIDLGAYGGTTQASLAPTEGDPPGVGAVDFRDYWPLSRSSNQWYIHNPDGAAYQIRVSGGSYGGGGEIYYLDLRRVSDWPSAVYCYYVNRTFYITQQAVSRSQMDEPPEQIQAQYPQFPVPGSTIDVPYDPFVDGTVEYRSVVVLRGTLAEALAGTSADPNQILEGSWPDVIAFVQTGEDGTPGDPVAIFARGFGPLWIAGQPVEGANIGSRRFGNVPAVSRGGG
ncbi:MAG: right-handed parallel beta-helix repeat-containing protein [Phycisphaerales bacterium]